MIAAAAARARDQPAFCALLVAVMAVGGFALDHVNTTSTQALFGVCALAAMAGVLATVPPEVRVQACLMGAMATLTEVLFSAAWGMYEYRLGNIPSFVPGGHALVFTCVWRLATRDGAQTGRRPPAHLWLAVGAAVTAVLIRHPDDGFGLVALGGWVLLALALPRDRTFLCFMMLAVLLVECSGTIVGAWTWGDHAPGLGLSMANPPVGIAACYCALDLIAIRTVEALWARRLGPERADDRHARAQDHQPDEEQDHEREQDDRQHQQGEADPQRGEGELAQTRHAAIVPRAAR